MRTTAVARHQGHGGRVGIRRRLAPRRLAGGDDDGDPCEQACAVEDLLDLVPQRPRGDCDGHGRGNPGEAVDGAVKQHLAFACQAQEDLGLSSQQELPRGCR